MAFNFPAVSYIIALISDAFLIFFSIFHVIAFDELKTDYKNPIDQCNSLNPVSLCMCLLANIVKSDTDSKQSILCRYIMRFLNAHTWQCHRFIPHKRDCETKQIIFSHFIIYSFTACHTGIRVAFILQYSIFAVRRMVFAPIECPTHCIPCI